MNNFRSAVSTTLRFQVEIVIQPNDLRAKLFLWYRTYGSVHLFPPAFASCLLGTHTYPRWLLCTLHSEIRRPVRMRKNPVLDL